MRARFTRKNTRARNELRETIPSKNNGTLKTGKVWRLPRNAIIKDANKSRILYPIQRNHRQSWMGGWFKPTIEMIHKPNYITNFSILFLFCYICIPLAKSVLILLLLNVALVVLTFLASVSSPQEGESLVPIRTIFQPHTQPSRPVKIKCLHSRECDYTIPAKYNPNESPGSST